MEELGEGLPISSIIASVSLAVLCLFYIYTVGTYFQIPIHPLIDRVIYYAQFHSYIVNEYVDHVVIASLLLLWLTFTQRSLAKYVAIGCGAIFISVISATNYSLVLDGIALCSLPTIIILLVYSRYSTKSGSGSSHLSKLTINYLVIIAIILGLVSFAFSIYHIAFPSSENNVISLRGGYAYDIFVLFSSFSPFILLILLACLPTKLLVDFARGRIRSLPHVDFLPKNITISKKLLILSASIALSIAIILIPHLPTVNTDNRLVSVDSLQYSLWIKELDASNSTQDFFHQIFVEHSKGDRPISLVLIFAFQQALSQNNDPSHTIEYLPFLLAPSLILAVYFLTQELTANDATSLLAAFLTAISFQTLIGIYAGFYANWISLVFGYLSLLFLFKFLRDSRMRNLVIYAVLLIVTLFSHVYTWSIIVIVSGVFLSVYLAKANLLSHRNDGKLSTYEPRKKVIVLLLLVLFCTVVIDVGRTIATGSSGGIEGDLQIGKRSVGLDQFALRWNNLAYTTTTYVGGIFANFLILGLGIYWLLASKMSERHNVFILIFLSVGILPFLFGDWIIQTRVLYDIPFQIPAALAIFYAIKQNIDARLRIIPIYIWLITISIISVSNFYLILPKT